MAKKNQDTESIEDTNSTKKQDNKNNRTRNFATIVYPESAPQNWLEILKDQKVSALVSPLHDKDKNPSGEAKKPHYHVMIMFDGVKNFETQVKPIFDLIGGVGRETINSMRGYARYLCHLDNPEKAQYKREDVISCGGADYQAIISLPTDDTKMLMEMIDFIEENQIYSFRKFVNICRHNNYDWFVVLSRSSSIFIKEYIKSMYWDDVTEPNQRR